MGGSGNRFVVRDEFTIAKHRKRAVAATIFSVVLLLGAVAIVLPLAGFFMIPTWRMLRGLPILMVDDWGVSLKIDGLRLPRSNIAEVQITSRPVLDNKAIPVMLLIAIDNERARREQRGLARKYAKDALRAYGGPLWVSCASLEESVPIEEVLAAIHRFSSVPIRRVSPENGK